MTSVVLETMTGSQGLTSSRNKGRLVLADGLVVGLHMGTVCWLRKGRQQSRRYNSKKDSYLTPSAWGTTRAEGKADTLPDIHPPKKPSLVENLVSNLFLMTEQSWFLEIAQEKVTVTKTAFLASGVSALSWHFLQCHKEVLLLHLWLSQPSPKPLTTLKISHLLTKLVSLWWDRGSLCLSLIFCRASISEEMMGQFKAHLATVTSRR